VSGVDPTARQAPVDKAGEQPVIAPSAQQNVSPEEEAESWNRVYEARAEKRLVMEGRNQELSARREQQLLANIRTKHLRNVSIDEVNCGVSVCKIAVGNTTSNSSSIEQLQQAVDPMIEQGMASWLRTDADGKIAVYLFNAEAAAAVRSREQD